MTTSHVQEFQKLLALSRDSIVTCIAGARRLYESLQLGPENIAEAVRSYVALGERLDAADLHQHLVLKPFLERVRPGVTAAMILAGPIIGDSHREGYLSANRYYRTAEDALEPVSWAEGPSKEARLLPHFTQRFEAVLRAVLALGPPNAAAFVPSSLREQSKLLLDWMGLLQAADRENPPATDPAKQGGGDTKGKRINEKMLAELQRNPSALKWSAQKWAHALACSKSTIQETPTWQTAIRSARAMQKAERLESD